MNFNHTCFFPLYGLELDANIGGEFSVENVQFVSTEKIYRIRKRLGLAQRVSDYERGIRSSILQPLFSAKAYAVVKTRRALDDKEHSLGSNLLLSNPAVSVA